MSKSLNKKIAFTGTLTLLSGLHIGNSNDVVEIGGIDRTLVRRPDNGQPYIPGSSLKGKMRSLLEQTRGAGNVGDSNQINGLFGIASFGKDKMTIASRLIVRDAYLSEASATALRDSPHTDFPYTEVKFENSIDRIKGMAGNPRKTERVPVGSVFNVSFVLNVWSDESEADHVNLLQEGIRLLEADYLGGSGSRGYGQVKLDMDWKGEVLYPAAAAGADKVAGV
jgi:CRISPR-associated protein Csm3